MLASKQSKGLHREMISHGGLIFKWRGQLPLIFLIPAILAIYQNFHMERRIDENVEDLWGILSFLVSLLGIFIRVFTVGYVPRNTSGRNTADQRADFLNVTGMYSITRNPLYLGNFIIILGVLFWAKVWFLLVIVSLVFFIYMERIILAEEAYLQRQFGKRYDNWNDKTPVLFPNFSLWQKPKLPFSWKTVLKREYPGLLAVSTVFITLQFVFDVVADRETLDEWIAHDWPAVIAYVAILIFCLAVRFLKRHTSVLKVNGR